MTKRSPERGRFPSSGKPAADVLAALADQRSRDLQADGRAFAFVYDAGREARELARAAFAACMPINGLDPTAYPSARTIENHIVGACLELLSAPEGAVGTATAGGTESVLLAVKTARDFAKRARPKMLLPETAHACFHKAAHYFGVEVVPVKVDPTTFRADVADARAKMDDDVILVVGSAPSYTHGVIDPIEELAALAREHGRLMHVDACVGGCVLPFLRDEGVPVPAFDFAVEGVTSISLDLHKYGFAPKGVSVLLQRRRELRDAQYYACGHWTGYTIVNSTTLGSKSAAAMGAAFALMHHLGRDGYRTRARQMWQATQLLLEAIDATPGLRVLGRPDMNLFAFTTTAHTNSTAGDVFELADRLTERGWHVQPTYSFGPSPAHIHLSLDPGNAARAADLAADIRQAMRDLPPPPAIPEPIKMLFGAIEAGAPLDTGDLMAQLGVADGRLPSRAAPIHRLMDAAPPRARERLLSAFVSELFT
jgi:glutamate/tyrosine decarboxylase-like PLP-dependent enzyme